MAAVTLPNICTRTVPYEDAEKSNQVLFDVLTLIHAAADLNEIGSTLSDVGTLTDEKSRMTNLLIQARDKTAEAIRHVNI